MFRVENSLKWLPCPRVVQRHQMSAKMLNYRSCFKPLYCPVSVNGKILEIFYHFPVCFHNNNLIIIIIYICIYNICVYIFSSKMQRAVYHIKADFIQINTNKIYLRCYREQGCDGTQKSHSGLTSVLGSRFDTNLVHKELLTSQSN